MNSAFLDLRSRALNAAVPRSRQLHREGRWCHRLGGEQDKEFEMWSKALNFAPRNLQLPSRAVSQRSKKSLFLT